MPTPNKNTPSSNYSEIDRMQLASFKSIVNAQNAHAVNREVEENRSFKMYRVALYDSYGLTIINEWNFSDKKAAEEAIEYAINTQPRND